MKKTKTTLGIAFLLMIIAFACRKEFSPQDEDLPISYLTEAKDYYYKQSKILGISAVIKQKGLSNNKRVNAIGKGKIRSITPLWYKSYLSKTGGIEFTEVPIASDEKMIKLYNFAKKAQDDKINLIRANSSFKRLLIYKTKSKNFHQLQLTYVPDYDYLEGNHFEASKTQIDKLDNFSGYIEYSSVKDEKVIFVLRIEQGKFIKKYYIAGNLPNEKNGRNSVKTNGRQIGTKGWVQQCDPVYGQICVLHGDPEVETCGPMMVVREDCYEVWVPDEEDPDDPCYDEEQIYICDPENPDPNETIGCDGIPGSGAYIGECGECIGGTTGIEECPEPLENPCDQASKATSQASATPISSVKATIIANSVTKEWGAEQNLTNWTSSSTTFNTVTPRESLSSTSNAFPSVFRWDATNGYTIGISHGHPGGSGPSPKDLFVAFGFLDAPQLVADTAARSFYKKNFSITTYLPDGTSYIVQINDWNNLATSYTNYNNNPNAFNTLFQDAALEYKTANASTDDGLAASYALLKMFGNDKITILKAPPGSNTFKPLRKTSDYLTEKDCP